MVTPGQDAVRDGDLLSVPVASRWPRPRLVCTTVNAGVDEKRRTVRRSVRADHTSLFLRRRHRGRGTEYRMLSRKLVKRPSPKSPTVLGEVAPPKGLEAAFPERWLLG